MQPPEQDEWPQLIRQKKPKKISANTRRDNMKSAQPAFALKDRHFNRETFDKHNLQLKPGTDYSKCKLPGRVKCQIEVKKPNELDVERLYSVPCGENKTRTARANPGSS